MWGLLRLCSDESRQSILLAVGRLGTKVDEDLCKSQGACLSGVPMGQPTPVGCMMMLETVLHVAGKRLSKAIGK